MTARRVTHRTANLMESKERRPSIGDTHFRVSMYEYMNKHKHGGAAMQVASVTQRADRGDMVALPGDAGDARDDDNRASLLAGVVCPLNRAVRRS